ncbi:interleukin-18 receptor 1-like [Micropterus salmoides]|uniref:interleukin-18 receptor 1-like n=1 Tax=Micropterus salmoides TaxID=27706 RepID=UPI0018EC8D16|nr:interleukin-18 receptor 1-like [Micropterus salmoides]
MMVKLLLVPLFLILTSLTGVCVRKPREIDVKTGEMVALHCPDTRYNHSYTKLFWTSYTTKKMDLTSNMSSAEQSQMGILVHKTSLVILNASVNHEGNYSCSLGNASSQFWFSLTVYTSQRKYEEGNMYSETCYTQKSCSLNCPDTNIPAENTPDITSNGITWHKEGESLPETIYFQKVEKNDQGVYTCTRSYLHHGQIYKMTFTVELDVKLHKECKKSAVITSPRKSVVQVDLGSTVVIDCEAVTCSALDDVFWLIGNSFVEKNNSFPVFYNNTQENNTEQIHMTASLVIKKVSDEDISKNYTCKLNSDQVLIFTLSPKPRPSHISLAVGVVGMVVVMVVSVVIYVKFKIDIVLFLRDTLGCHRSTSDGKGYDAFLMYYKSDTNAGLNAYDRNWLRSVLEEKYGYSLCLYDRDVLPGKAVAEAVLDCIEQSRAVVLVPASPDPGPGSGLLSVIHAALVERQTRLVFIKTETTEMSRSGSLPEALQLLGEAGDCVTWKGISSTPPSSSFWKQLRYYLPAPQHAQKQRLLSQTI